MALGDFTTGPYTATWKGNALGLVDENGFMIGDTPIKEVIKASLHGENLIDKIYQGRAVKCVATFIEWTSYIRGLINPYHSNMGNPGQHATLDSVYAGALVLTAASGTPAATALGPATITMHLCAPSDENEIQWALNSKLRTIPILFDCYYSDVSGTKKYYTIT
jgi:hypothetical protein